MGRLVEPIPSIRTKIEKYFNLADEIHEYFGYKEDWKCIPMNSQLDQYWFITGDGRVGDKYVHSPEPLTKESIEAGSNIYSGSIYTQRFLPKWVYRGKEFTLVCADTHTDGNKFLMIFDNNKECKDDKLKEAYIGKWTNL